MKRDYDTTLARIAGNIAAGMVTRPDLHRADHIVAQEAVDLARAIVARIREIEPAVKP